jgi:DNA-directed RNA polymerase specialized sigma24 family protein
MHAASVAASIGWGRQLPFMSALGPPPPPRLFTRRGEVELARLPDEDLVAYIARAKDAGADAHARTAVFLLLHRHEQRMRRKVQAQVPAFVSHHADTIEEWVLERVWSSALKLPLTGASAGEWTNWWKTVVARQVVSFWRSTQGQALEKEIEWPDLRPAGPKDSPGADTIGEDSDSDALVRGIDYRAAIDAALAELSAAHQAVVEAAYFEDRPSKDVGAEFGETQANVDQIKKRFRNKLRAELVATGIRES